MKKPDGKVLMVVQYGLNEPTEAISKRLPDALDFEVTDAGALVVYGAYDTFRPITAYAPGAWHAAGWLDETEAR